MSAFPNPQSAIQNPQCVAARLAGIRTWITGQLRQQHALGQHDPRNPILISADQAVELIEFLESLGIDLGNAKSSTLPTLNAFPFIAGSN